MANTTKTAAASERALDELIELHDRVISRVEEKGESVEQAIEAVIGAGTGKLFNRVYRFVYGDRK